MNYFLKNLICWRWLEKGKILPNSGDKLFFAMVQSVKITLALDKSKIKKLRAHLYIYQNTTSTKCG